MKESRRRNSRQQARYRRRRGHSTLLAACERSECRAATRRGAPDPFRLRRADFPAFRNRFETLQIFRDLFVRVFAEDSRQRSADVSRGRRVFELDSHFRGAGTLVEMYRARVMDRRAGQRAPSDQLPGDVVDDFGLPRQLVTCRRAYAPARPGGRQHGDFLNVTHELRKRL